MNFDVIIIGGGAAGLSAELWCAELGLNALLLEAETELGGQLLWTHNQIKNHLGIEAENGRKLRDIFIRQVERRQFNHRLHSEISDIDFENKRISLKSGEGFSAQSLVIATGIRRRKLNVAGEEKFKNKGIIESGKRDGNLVKGKKALIVGGGDAAFENALILAKTASEVTLVHRQRKFRARAEFVEQAKNNPKVKILTGITVREFVGKTRIEAVELENLETKQKFTLAIEAVLIRIGVEPNTEILCGKLELDEQGYVKIDQHCETNVKDIYAIGDVANPIAPTISSAVGMGATAAKAISNYKLRIEEEISRIRNS
ncbi:MAG: NAD(P)/FAD-dependent oxidoreductase [Acidobacteriota bacterium]|nr:NAD(P)/FAD-dependent oxidoreductase [Acidobacteriota bacterium]